MRRVPQSEVLASRARPKPWWHSKTIWANIALAGIDVLNQVAKVIPSQEATKYILFAAVVINIILRQVTHRPIRRKRSTRRP